jgi:small-conductance mechanosensitive channel
MNVPAILSDLLDIQLSKNSMTEWTAAALTMLLVYTLIMGIKTYVSNHVQPDPNRGWLGFRIIRVLIRSTTRLFGLAISLFVGCQFLDLPDKKMQVLTAIPTTAFLLQVGYWGKSLVDFKLNGIIESKRDIHEKLQFQTLVSPVKFIALCLLWTLIFLAILDNMGVNVTSLIAGLGIGGVAVALAVQNTLTDLLSALSIALDKPFIVGDFISTAEYSGTVEKIGLKSTRIRSLSGEELVVPNQELLKAKIQNYKKMDERRVVFGFGVLLQTEADQLAKIPTLVQNVIENQQRIRFDRAHFYRFGDSSYDYEVVYYVLSPDYNVYMDIQQQINLAIVQEFQSLGIQFAYPTRTLYVNQPEPLREPSLNYSR